MATSTAPFVLNNLTLTLKKVKNADGSTATGTAAPYECQLNAATLTPAAGTTGEQTYETFCAEHKTPGSASTWSLSLAGFQAYADVADLSVLLFNDEGAVYEFVLVPTGGTIAATNPGFQGQVTLVPTTIGGTANQYASFTVELPCTTKPTMISTPPTAMQAEGQESEGEESEQGELVAA